MTSTARAIERAALRGVGMTVRAAPVHCTQCGMECPEAYVEVDEEGGRCYCIPCHSGWQLPEGWVDLDSFSCPSPNDAD